ncbi:uncharacterized protein K489DRAFT_371251 [Dissoconium aciculare CBS 342.82]|uniref:Uncharacterized protein n=1 Tax=Dissoconium aciculare CBS 342.82 TaxID=1314786 RepID=A0A6J3M3D3_9PEZI|nr:uncharacterized protein K489DRAFT_371251 [Dissoconium aciculare CBS 342.82]KAF1822408.1 hypothetical protein K489DRAFT_371251 [Dissoconium aciculare CBS 342.82]
MADIPSNSPQPHAGGLLLLSVDHSPHSSWGGRIVLIGSVNEDCRMPLTCLTQNPMSAAAPQAIRGQEMWSTYVKTMVFSTPPVRGWFGLRPTRYAETMPMLRHECAQRGECCGSEYSCRPGISIMLSNWVMTNLGMPCPAITIHGLTLLGYRWLLRDQRFHAGGGDDDKPWRQVWCAALELWRMLPAWKVEGWGKDGDRSHYCTECTSGAEDVPLEDWRRRPNLFCAANSQQPAASRCPRWVQVSPTPADLTPLALPSAFIFRTHFFPSFQLGINAGKIFVYLGTITTTTTTTPAPQYPWTVSHHTLYNRAHEYRTGPRRFAVGRRARWEWRIYCGHDHDDVLSLLIITAIDVVFVIVAIAFFTFSRSFITTTTTITIVSSVFHSLTPAFAACCPSCMLPPIASLVGSAQTIFSRPASSIITNLYH